MTVVSKMVKGEGGELCDGADDRDCEGAGDSIGSAVQRRLLLLMYVVQN